MPNLATPVKAFIEILIELMNTHLVMSVSFGIRVTVSVEDIITIIIIN